MTLPQAQDELATGIDTDDLTQSFVRLCNPPAPSSETVMQGPRSADVTGPWLEMDQRPAAVPTTGSSEIRSSVISAALVRARTLRLFRKASNDGGRN